MISQYNISTTAMHTHAGNAEYNITKNMLVVCDTMYPIAHIVPKNEYTRIMSITSTKISAALFSANFNTLSNIVDSSFSVCIIGVVNIVKKRKTDVITV